MKIKLNWGGWLILGMGAFMLYISAMGVYMFCQSSDDYDHQYYEKGLAYDSVYNQEKQVVTDKVQPILKVEQVNLHINFIAPANGSIQFERLADPSLDRVVAFNSDTKNEVIIPLDKFKTGRWDLSLAWVNNGKKYLYQKQIRVK